MGRRWLATAEGEASEAASATLGDKDSSLYVDSRLPCIILFSEFGMSIFHKAAYG
jgi:hypothetical protein